MSQVSARPFAFPLPGHSVSPFDHRLDGHKHPSTEYPSPRKSLSPLQREYTHEGWNSLHRRSPMQEDRKEEGGSPPKDGGSQHHTRPDLTQRPSREQLPSLMSLFGSSETNRLPQPQLQERRSPIFPPARPQQQQQQLLKESRHPAPLVHLDRPFDSAYQRTPATSLFPYSSWSDLNDRSRFQPPARTSQQDTPYSPLQPPRTQVASTSKTWSPVENSRPEYFGRDASSSFANHTDMYLAKPSQTLDAERSPVYHDLVHSAPMPSNYGRTSASNTSNEPATMKDGLGPKIWTGSQFLPRFLRQAEVPGEGMCYFYDDNTHCKTVIDGEPVNAHWGVTKAGKPRKRLAIACITCREKKIKCDPDYPRCVQCEKFGRVCKFKNAPRGSQGSPDTPPADTEDTGARPSSSRTDDERFEVEQRTSSASISPRQPLRRPTPESETQPPKRQRNTYTNFTPVSSEPSPRIALPEAISPKASWTDSQTLRSVEQSRSRSTLSNHAHAQSRFTPELLALFFQNINQIGYSMFPRLAFQSWVLSSATKTTEDLTLISSVLACGAVFSSNPEHKQLGAEYALTSRNACGVQPLSLQLVQSRLLLAVYYTASGSTDDSWDMCGAAIRAAMGLKMNLELDTHPGPQAQETSYGLNRAGFAECRRRTFWSCYVMDRLDSFVSGRSSSIRPEEVFLRLPCDTESFEMQHEVLNPFFNPTEPPRSAVTRTLGILANFISICTIWDDIMLDIYLSSHSVTPPSRHFDTFYRSCVARLRMWTEQLPQDMVLSPENLKNAARCGALGRFMTLHAIYLTASMKLNRYIRESPSVHLQFGSNVQTALQHASELLEMFKWAATYYAVPENTTREFEPSSPFFGYAISTAVDILTAKPSLSALPSFLVLVGGAEKILDKLARLWPSSKQQQAMVSQRIRDVTEIARVLEKGGGNEHELAKFKGLCKNVKNGSFQMNEPLERAPSHWKDYDLLYT